ncbi:MAG: helix-turn-helix domain-containing protein [Bacillaceae bacterium]
MLIGEKLRRLRIARQLSQEQLAEKLQVSRQAISKWELGESMPDTENLILLSKFYGVSIDYLLLNELNISSELETKRSRSFPIFIFGMGGLVIGLILSIVLWCTYQSILMVSIGLIIQIISVTAFVFDAFSMDDISVYLFLYRVVNDEFLSSITLSYVRFYSRIYFLFSCLYGNNCYIEKGKVGLELLLKRCDKKNTFLFATVSCGDSRLNG